MAKPLLNLQLSRPGCLKLAWRVDSCGAPPSPKANTTQMWWFVNTPPSMSCWFFPPPRGFEYRYFLKFLNRSKKFQQFDRLNSVWADCALWGKAESHFLDPTCGVYPLVCTLASSVCFIQRTFITLWLVCFRCSVGEKSECRFPLWCSIIGLGADRCWHSS